MANWQHQNASSFIGDIDVDEEAHKIALPTPDDATMTGIVTPNGQENTIDIPIIDEHLIKPQEDTIDIPMIDENLIKPQDDSESITSSAPLALTEYLATGTEQPPQQEPKECDMEVSVKKQTEHCQSSCTVAQNTATSSHWETNALKGSQSKAKDIPVPFSDNDELDESDEHERTHVNAKSISSCVSSIQDFEQDIADQETIKALPKTGADMNARNNDGSTLLL